MTLRPNARLLLDDSIRERERSKERGIELDPQTLALQAIAASLIDQTEKLDLIFRVLQRRS